MANVHRKSRMIVIILSLMVALAMIPQVSFGESAPLQGRAYAVFDSADNTLTFFRAAEGAYTDEQVIGTKTYFDSNIETANWGGSNGHSWSSKEDLVTKVVFADAIRPRSTSYWFQNFKNLKKIENIEKLDTSEAISLSCMFSGCGLEEIDVSTFDTRNVTDLWAMFASCQQLKRITGFEKLDTSKVEHITALFNACPELEYVDVSKLNTSKAKNLGSVFGNCKKLSATITVAKMPDEGNYHGYTDMCKNAATEPGAQIVLKHLDPVTESDIEKLIATTANTNSNVIKGEKDLDAAVATIGDKSYRALSTAIAAAGTEETEIKVIKDITESVIIPAGAKITIDLNGHKITNVLGEHTITNNGVLTVKSANGTATIDNISDAAGCIVNNIGATATISGNIKVVRSMEDPSDTTGNNSWYNIANRGTMTIENGVDIVNNGIFTTAVTTGHLNVETLFPDVPEAKLTLNGGSITGGKNCIKIDSGGNLEMNGGVLKNTYGPAILNWNVATINGGTIEGKAAMALAKHTRKGDSTPSEPTEKGIVTIKGGVLTGTDTLFVQSTSGQNEAGIEVTIEDGTFNGQIPAMDKATITVYGGKFDNDVKEKVVLAEWRYLEQGEGAYYYVKKLSDEEIAIVTAIKEMIEALPEKDRLTLSDKDAVDLAEEAYVSLSDIQKQFIDDATKTKLDEAVAKIGELEAEALAKAKTEAKDELDKLLEEKKESDYDPEDWTALNKVITDGKAAIDDAKNIPAVDEAKKAAIDALAEIKTKDEKAKEALDAAKEAAKDVLDNLLEGKKEADYDPEDWKELTKAIEDGKKAIDEATTIEGVDEAKKAAEDAVGKIKTKEEKEAKTLEEAKTAAKHELDTLLAGKNESDYDPEDWTALNKAITDGKAAIDDAETTEGVDKAKNDAIDAVAEIKTKDEKAKEALDAAKEAAKDVLDNLLEGKKEADYDPEDWKDLTKAIEDGKKAIDEAATIEGVEEAKKAAEDAVGKIKTKEHKDREAADAVAELINALPAKENVTVNDFEEIGKARGAYEALTDSQKAFIDDDTLKKLKDAEEALATIVALDEVKARAKEDIAVKTGPDKISSLTEKQKKKITDIAEEGIKNIDDAKTIKNVIEAYGDAVEKITKAFDEISDEGKGSDPDQKGKDGTPIGEGASAAAADKFITTANMDKDPKGSKFAPLKLKSSNQGKKNIKLAWTKTKKAAKYVIYGNQCGWTKKMKKLKTVKGKSANITKIKTAKLKNGKMYKFVIVALNKDNMVVSTSKVIHVGTKGGKICNPKKVTVKAKKGKKWKTIKKATVKKGKYIRLKAVFTKQYKKKKISMHAGVKGARYESTNAKVAKVNTKGVIIGKKKGTCTIYVYSQNGLHKTVKVTVK